MNYITKGIMSIVGMLTIVGCQAAVNNAASNFSSANSATGSKAVFQQFTTTQKSTDYAKFVEDLGNMTLADQYQLSINNATNAAMQIDLYIWDGVGDDLAAIADSFDALAGTYYLLSDYWTAIGFDPAEQINEADFEAGLAAMDKGMQIQNQTSDSSSLTSEETIATAKAYIVFRSMGQKISGGAAVEARNADFAAGQWIAPLMEDNQGRKGKNTTKCTASNSILSETSDFSPSGGGIDDGSGATGDAGSGVTGPAASIGSFKDPYSSIDSGFSSGTSGSSAIKGGSTSGNCSIGKPSKLPKVDSSGNFSF